MNKGRLEVKLAHIRGAREIRERRKANRLVNDKFVAQMEAELKANAHKGDWRQWKPSCGTAAKELQHHVQKLNSAMRNGEKSLVLEFAADVANIAMKIAETHGTLLVTNNDFYQG